MDGLLGPGDRVPSESQLIEHYALARMTIRQALDELKAEGLVVVEHGRGVFVRQRPSARRVASDRFMRAHREAGRAAFIAESVGVGTPSVDEIEVSHEVAAPHVAAVLRLSKRSRVVARRRRYLIGEAERQQRASVDLPEQDDAEDHPDHRNHAQGHRRDDRRAGAQPRWPRGWS